MRPSPVTVAVSSRLGVETHPREIEGDRANAVSVAVNPFVTGCGGPGVSRMPCSTHSSKPCDWGFGPTRSRACSVLPLTIVYGCGIRTRSGRASVVASIVPLSPRANASPRTVRPDTQ